MSRYLLFIDTEASGLPKSWNLPFTADDNWPHAMQVAWIIYDEQQNIIKKADHYIKNDGFAVQPGALEIHGITNEYLEEHGETREQVLKLLSNDLREYQPMIIGHFVQLDYYILSVDFLRSGMNNPLNTVPVFCTMVATKQLRRGAMNRHLRLGELYQLLFNEELRNQHNAMNDAQATADCFFEMQQRGEIGNDSITEQNTDFDKIRQPNVKNSRYLLAVVFVVLLIILIVCLYE